jgi:hypothetical protein
MPISKRRAVNGAPIDPALAAMGDAYLGSRGKHAQPEPDPAPPPPDAFFHCLGCGWGGPRALRYQRDHGRTCLCPKCGRLARREAKVADPRPAPAARPDLRSAREILGPVKLEAIAVSLLGCCTLRDLDSAREVVRFVIRAADEHGLPPRVGDEQLRHVLDELRLLRALRDSIVFRRSCPLCLEGDLDYRFARGVAQPFPFPDQAGARLSLRAACPSCGQVELRPGLDELRGVQFVVVVLSRRDAVGRPAVEGFRAPSGEEGKEQRGDSERPARPSGKGGHR